jgi:hypothetical protein
MRCKKVIRLLNEGRLLDESARQHLSGCPSCRDEVAAAEALSAALIATRADDHNNATQFARLRSRVEAQAPKETSIMSKIFENITSRPRTALGVSIAAALFLFVTLVPFSYQTTAGYKVAFSGVDPSVSPQVIEKSLAALGYSDISISVSTDNDRADYFITNVSSKSQAREIAAAFASLAHFTGEPVLTPVKKTVSGTLYAQARDRLIEIRIDGAGKTDDEIAAEIRGRLEAEGLSDVNASFSTRPDGMKQIDITFSSDSDSYMELQIVNDGSSLQPEGISIQPDRQDEGKTDAEVKADIEAELRAKGIADPQVTVTTTPDGKREVNVEAEKR